MKASLRLRDHQQAPMIKAKVPFTLLNLPLTSSIVAGDPCDLQLAIATAFRCGPTVQAAYRPNNAKAPFAVSVRLGAGDMGSPVGSAIVMKAEIGASAGASPRFSVLFRPCFGDFRIRKAFQSNSHAQATSNLSENGVKENGVQSSVEVTGDNGSIFDIFSGAEVTAVSAIPVRNNAAEFKFRWGVRLPPSATVPHYTTSVASISPSRLPYLAMSKISVKQISRKDVNGPKGLNDASTSSRDNTDMLDKIITENKMLTKELADLWSEIVARRKTSTEFQQRKRERQIEHRPTTGKQSFTPRGKDNTTNSRNNSFASQGKDNATNSRNNSFASQGKDNATSSRNNEAAEELRKALEGSVMASAKSKK